MKHLLCVKRTRTPVKKNLSGQFLLLPTCIKRTPDTVVFMIVCTIYSLSCSFDPFCSTQYCFVIFFGLCKACFTQLIWLQIWCPILCLCTHVQLTLPKGTTQNAMTWWSPTRIEPQVVSSRHIYFMEDNLLHAFSNLGYVYFHVVTRFFVCPK